MHSYKMDQPPPSSQKRTLLEDNIPDISTGGAPDHQSKRIRITLPPPVSLISPTQQGNATLNSLYSLPLPTPAPPQQLPAPVVLPPLSATVSTMLTSPISSQKLAHQTRELPPIESLAPPPLGLQQPPPLPPPPPPPPPQATSTTSINRMSVKSILTSPDLQPFKTMSSPSVSQLPPSFPLQQPLSQSESFGSFSPPPTLNLPNGHREPQVIVENDESLNMDGIQERRLGYVIYSPKEILPPLEFKENGLLEVWIPSMHLTWDNQKVRKRELWGTDIYTDDSDVVAALIHTGKYVPKTSNYPDSFDYPDHDLCVTVRVMPKLMRYHGSMRHKMLSRSWGNHHGGSYKIENIQEMKKGESLGRSRWHGRKERLRKYLQMRKKVLGDQSEKVFAFNSESDPCLKYNKDLMSDPDELKERLKDEVAILENDYERYELSYDSQTLKYRFAVISSHVHLSSSGCYRSNSNGISNSDIPSLPLDSSSVDETISDNLEIRDLDWNPVGLVIRIPSGEGQCVGTNGIGSGNGHVNGNGNANGSVQARSMLVVVKLVYWRKRTR